MEKSRLKKTHAKVEDDIIDNTFVLEAVIEQLKYEKQAYANQCKEYVQIFNALYTQYPTLWSESLHKPIERMNASELRSLFKLGTKTGE